MTAASAAADLRVIHTWTKPSFAIAIHPVETCSVLSAELAVLHVWDWQRTEHLRRLLSARAPSLVVDVGAHIGYVSLYVAALGHEVVAFEPLALNRRCFEASLALQPELAARIRLEPLALSDRAETRAMFSQVDNIGNGELGAGLPEGRRVMREEVATVRMDAYFESAARPANEELYIVKIDVESFEPAVILGADRLLADGRIRHLFIECSPAWSKDSGLNPQAMFERLAATGYTMCDEATGLVMTADGFAQRAADPQLSQFELFASRAPHELFPDLATGVA